MSFERVIRYVEPSGIMREALLLLEDWITKNRLNSRVMGTCLLVASSESGLEPEDIHGLETSGLLSVSIN